MIILKTFLMRHFLEAYKKTIKDRQQSIKLPCFNTNVNICVIFFSTYGIKLMKKTPNYTPIFK